MTLTDAQLATFKADIQGNSAVAAALAAGANNAIAAWYNNEASPQFYVYTDHVDFETVRQALEWSETISLPLQALQQLRLLADPSFDPSRPGVRDGLVRIFPAETYPLTRAAVLAVASKTATNAEKLFAVGAGTQGNPATSPFLGSVTSNDVRDALALP